MLPLSRNQSALMHLQTVEQQRLLVTASENIISIRLSRSLSECLQRVA